MSDPLCANCNQPIPGDILRWGSSTYHLDHLRCSKCACQLGQGVSIKNFSGKPYCANCWNDVFWGAGKPGAPATAPAKPAAAPVQAPAPTPVAKPVVAPALAPAVVVQTPAPVAAAPLVAPAHPMKDQIEGAAVLKHTQPVHDASAPRIEPTVQVKKVDREAFKAEVSSTPQLKHVEEKRDVSAPKIDSNVQVKTKPIMERQIFLSSVEKAATTAAAATPAEKAIKLVETHVRMVEAAAKSVESNKQNVADAHAKAPGAPSVEEANKSLATAEELFNVQVKNLQVRYNHAANEVERGKGGLSAEWQGRWRSVQSALQARGLSTA